MSSSNCCFLTCIQVSQEAGQVFQSDCNIFTFPSAMFKLWCWRRLLRVPWTARRSIQSILKEINPEYSLEGPMLKLKLQYFGHLIWKTDTGKDPDAGKGFPDSPIGKESVYNAGDPGSIPGSGRSTGEGIGYPFQYSETSFVAQLVKNPPAMLETWVRSTPIFWPREFHGLYRPWVTKSQTHLNDFHF